MRHLFFTFFLLLAWGGHQTELLAQAKDQAVVFELTGKVKYTAADGGKVKLEPGSVLTENGALGLQKGATVGIFYKSSFLYLDGPLDITYTDLVASEDFASSRFTSIFGEQLGYANLDGFTKKGFKKFEKNGFTGGSKLPPKKERDGGGNKDRAVSIQEPLQGKISDGATIRFDWSLRERNASVQQFEFSLSEEGGAVVYTQKVAGYDLTLNLNEVGATAGKTYRWAVDAIGYDGIDSGPLKIEYVEAQSLNSLKSRLVSDPSYQRANPLSKLLMEATLFEQTDYLQAAKVALDKARAQARRNPLVNQMYNAFIYKFDIK